MRVYATGEVKKAIKELLTVRVPRAIRFGGKVYWKFTRRSFFDGERFPTGFLDDVVELLQATGLNVKVQFEEERLPSRDPVPLPLELKPFQRRAIDRAVEMKRAVIYGPVSSGKTIIAVGIAATLGYPFLYLTHRRDIARQSFEVFKKLLPDRNIQLVMGSKRFTQNASVVATFQSLRDADLLDFPILLCDESHHVVSEVFSRVVSNCNAPYRFGFTGTPRGRSDALDFVMEKLIGPVLQITDFEEVKREGLVCDVRFVMVVVNEPLSFSNPQDFHEAEETFIVGGSLRNELIKKICETTLDGVVLVVVRRIEHGRALSEMIPGAIYVDSKSPLSLRDKVRKLEKGVVIATGIVDEGIDNKHIALMVNAAGGKSSILTHQRLGRGLRFKEGKTLVFVDFVDLGHPLLFKHSRKRYSVYKKLGEVTFLDLNGKELQNPFGRRRA